VSKLSDLHAEGITDLDSYFAGERDREAEIVQLIESEMKTLEPQIAQWSEPALHRHNALRQVLALIKREEHTESGMKSAGFFDPKTVDSLTGEI